MFDVFYNSVWIKFLLMMGTFCLVSQTLSRRGDPEFCLKSIYLGVKEIIISGG